MAATSGKMYMSFTPSIANGFNWDEVEDVSKKIDIDTPMPLSTKWCVWVQIHGKPKENKYDDNFRQVASFDTVQTFWRVYAKIPQPAYFVQGKKFMIEKNDQRFTVDGIMLFRDGIEPKWEDPEHVRGGRFTLRLKPTDAARVDEVWNNIVLALVGNSIEHGSVITGIRLVNKLNVLSSPSIRIEIWYGVFDKGVGHALQDTLGDILGQSLDPASAQEYDLDKSAFS